PMGACQFFFSSRRRHTRFSRDWSSDVCSSDLVPYLFGGARDHWARYQRTIHVLPEIGGRMGPDLQHLVLEALSLIAAVTLTRLALTRLRASQAGVLDDDTSREVGA